MASRSRRHVPGGSPLSRTVRRVSFLPTSSVRGNLLPTIAVLLLLLPGVGAAAGPFLPGGALGPIDHDRVRTELERTDQVIARAANAVGDCTARKGSALLETAKQVQGKAWDLFSSPAGNARERDQRDQKAADLSDRARKLAIGAIEACSAEVGAHDALRSIFDSTQDLVDQATSVVNASGGPESRRLLDAGIWQLDKAREAYRSGEYRRAVTLTAAARTLIQRALQRARDTGGDAGVPRIDAALDRTDLLIAEVESSAAGAPKQARVVTLLDKARKEQDQARSLFDGGRPGLALRRTRAARSSALDALWILQSTPRADRVGAAIESVDRLVQEAAPDIAASGSDEAVRLLDKAREQIALGRRLLQDGRTGEAAAAARTADSLLRRAVEKTGGG